MLVYGVALARGADHSGAAPHLLPFRNRRGEHLRSNRSFVLVANHSSHLDTVCLLAGLPLRRLHRAFPAAAADYFFKSVPRTWIATVVVNAFPSSDRLMSAIVSRFAVNFWRMPETF